MAHWLIKVSSGGVTRPAQFSWDQIEFFWDNKQLRVRFDRDNTTGDWDIQLILQAGTLRSTDTLEIYPMVSGQRGLQGIQGLPARVAG